MTLAVFMAVGLLIAACGGGTPAATTAPASSAAAAASATVAPTPKGPPDDVTIQLTFQVRGGLASLAAAQQKGYFKDENMNVTFAKGSAELTPKAKEVIGQLTKILNSPVAKDYELMVAGHTDSTPVKNPSTISQGHKDNWYLSAHRAISVGHEMIGDGINPRRMGVAGYGDQRPVASNVTPEGQAKNRRVEVAIMPTTYRGPSVPAGSQDALKVQPTRNTTAPRTHVAPKEADKDTLVPAVVAPKVSSDDNKD
jgi:outer membrane protein OmpA-like peptidoglycan-associated protein